MECSEGTELMELEWTCWARNGDVMCVLTYRAELSFKYKTIQVNDVQNCDSYINIPSSQTYK
jgi:hypothetical protein